jgi:hypothetical protein
MCVAVAVEDDLVQDLGQQQEEEVVSGVQVPSAAARGY